MADFERAVGALYIGEYYSQLVSCKDVDLPVCRAVSDV